MAANESKYPDQSALISRDIFDYRHRADGIFELLNQRTLPFIFSVEGEWGRGKSTLVEQIIERVQGYKSDTSNDQYADSWEIVRYHPWRYDIREFDDAWESLLEIMRDELNPDQVTKDFVDLLRHNRWARLITKVGGAIGETMPGGSLAVAAFEKIATGFDEFVDKSIEIGPRYIIFERLRQEVRELTKKKRILVVIDDLDRCSSTSVCHILRCIPTLFAPEGKEPRIAILLALDWSLAKEALVVGQGMNQDQAERFLEELIHVHVTLPILQFGKGDRAVATKKMRAAIKKNIMTAISSDLQGGAVHFNANPHEDVKFYIGNDRLDVIARFMNYNPRKFEKFIILFDLKWKSRLRANSKAHFDRNPCNDANTYKRWLDEFRDRLIYETIVELRWPAYDAKTGDIDANKKAIELAVQRGLLDTLDLPCRDFLDDPHFLEIYQILDKWSQEVNAG